MKLAYAVIVLLVGMLVGGYFYERRAASAAKPPAGIACVNSANELCPPPQYLDSYHDWKQLGVKVKADAYEIQKTSQYQAVVREQRELGGMAVELSQQTPKGWLFDEAKMKFVPDPHAPPVKP